MQIYAEVSFMSGIVHDRNYVTWAQYSMNRLMGANLKTDGTITPLYRAWINEFQVYTKCPTVGGQVDKWTQDHIIAINNVDTNSESRLYLGWVQHCLNILGFGKNLVTNGMKTKATKAAICAFQSSVKHKHIDGVVGPKTERDLAQKVPNLLVPGYSHGPIVPDPVQHQRDQWLESTTDARGLDQRIDNWLHLFSQELIHSPGTIGLPLERRVVTDMIKALQLKAAPVTGKNDYVTKEDVKLYGSGAKKDHFVSDIAQDANVFLRAKVGKFHVTLPAKAKYAAFKSAMRDLYRVVDGGVKEIFYQYSVGGGTHAGTFAELSEWYEEQHAKPNSLIACIPPPPGSPYHPF